MFHRAHTTYRPGQRIFHFCLICAHWPGSWWWYNIRKIYYYHHSTSIIHIHILMKTGGGNPWISMPLQWRHNGHDSVSNHQPHDCLLNHLFNCRSKKTSTLRVTGLCAGNSPGIGEFPAQMASNAENVSIWWRLMYLSGASSYTTTAYAYYQRRCCWQHNLTP